MLKTFSIFLISLDIKGPKIRKVFSIPLYILHPKMRIWQKKLYGTIQENQQPT
jgi:hypothetical protein